MGNSLEGRAAAIDRIVELVQGISDGLPAPAAITRVWRHEPQAIYDGRTAAVVYRGDTEPDGFPRKTFGHVMTALRFDVSVYWPVGGYDPGYLDDIELEIMDVDRAIVAALSDDRDLDGNVSTLTFGDSDTSYITFTAGGSDEVVARKLTRPVFVQLLDAEAVAQ